MSVRSNEHPDGLRAKAEEEVKMNLRKQTLQGMDILWQNWFKKKSIWSPLTISSAFVAVRSYHIIKSPPLVSLDIPDIWTSTSTGSDYPPVQECTEKKIGTKQANFLDHATHTARVIDGKSISEKIIWGIANEVRRMKKSIGKVPGLAVVMVGERRESQTYVRNKKYACEGAGINFVMTHLPDNCTEVEVFEALSIFNNNPSIHGILVQLPLPKHFNEGKILDALSLQKDVDGFHPLNMGMLAIQGREPLFIPCAPKGCIELLLRSDVEIRGKNVVVIGRGNIVGLPASLLLQRHHGTVSIVHEFTSNPEEITREADILVTAVGVPYLVRGSWIKPGALVVDVGTYPVEDPKCEFGYRLVGDVCYEEALRVASAVTPVPGGVGPMTVAMLLSNTLESAKRAYIFN